MHHQRAFPFLVFLLISVLPLHAGNNVWSPNGLTSSAINVLTLDPASSLTMYSGTTSQGIFKTTNGGGDWAAINIGLGDSLYVYALAIDPGSPSILYAAANPPGSESGAIFKTTDGGGTWNQVYSNFYSVTSLAVSPLDPSVIYAGAFCGEVRKTTDAGNSWNVVDIVGESCGVEALVLDPADPDVVYGATCFGLYRSTNGGSAWTKTIADRGVYALAVDPVTHSTLYAGASNGTYKSTDSGAGWAAYGPPSPYVMALAINPADPATIYAGTRDNGVYRSSNGGLDWNQYNPGLTVLNVRSLVFDPGGAFVQAGTVGGVFSMTFAACTDIIYYAQPASLAIPYGKSVQLDERATGWPYTAQWYLGTSGDTSNPIPGATTTYYVTGPLTSTASYWVRLTNDCSTADSETATITVLPALLYDNFEDGILPANWTYVNPTWLETGGALTVIPASRGASALAAPAFQGCLQCSVSATMRTSGGHGSTVSLFGWYVDSRNNVELMMKESKDSWVLRQRVNGVIVRKTRVRWTGYIDPQVDFLVDLKYDGSSLTFSLNGLDVITWNGIALTSGTVGFQAKKTTASFGDLWVW